MSNSICSFHVSVSHFGNFCNISGFFIIIFYGNVQSVFFDVTVITVLGHHKLSPYKTVSLMDKVCVLFALSVGHFPVYFSLLGPFYFLRHSNIEIRPTNNPTMASKFSSERKSCTSLTLVVYELF